MWLVGDSSGSSDRGLVWSADKGLGWETADADREG